MIDNYEVIRQNWRQRFLEMDHAQLARRFGLKMDDDCLYMTYFSHPFAISRSEGRIVRLDRPEMEIGFNLEMNFFNMFHYAKEQPAPSGEMVPFRKVKRAGPFEAAYQRTILAPFAERFTGHVAELAQAFRRLNARPLVQGDASGRLEVYPGLCVDVIFWDGDDEFPAQANMLFDSNITDYMHEENVVMVASDAAWYLADAAGLNDPEALMGYN